MTDIVPAGRELRPPGSTDAQTATDTAPPLRQLSQRAKAAVIVRVLLDQGADVPLDALPERLQSQLTEEMGALRLIDRTTLSAVVREFAEELDGVGLAFPNGLAGALSRLDGRISPQTAARLRKEAGVRDAGDPWGRLRGAPLDDLLGLATGESVEIAAVLLSKLDVGKAAELLASLPGPRARAITYAVRQTAGITPDAVARIGLSLATQLDTRPDLAFDAGPEDRVGAILNYSGAATRDDMLSALQETDADFADGVRRAIFTFADLPARIDPRDAPRITREVEQAMLVNALKGARNDDDKAAAAFLLDNLSKRMADTLREEVEDAPAVKLKEAEAAMSAVVMAARALIDQGEIEMRTTDEDDAAEDG